MTLLQGTDGDFYGTTYQGGSGKGCYGGDGPGCGTVFRITPDGALKTLHNFCARGNCSDGYYPYAGLVQGTDGNFYGTTEAGGANLYYGTVFKITRGGKLTTLHSFCSSPSCADGQNPMGVLVQATDGNFYGTTNGGGSNREGTIFKITPSGEFAVLYSFCAQSGCADGGEPYAGLIQGADGNLYGTTYYGGVQGVGVVFKSSLAGQFETLHSFCSVPNCADGSVSFAPLVQGGQGNLYGTTIYGGSTGCCGTIFEVTPQGQFTSLYTFCSQPNCDDGGYPSAGLVLGTDSELYGTTGADGANGNYGTVFRVTGTGAFTMLYSFCAQGGCTDGANPYGGLLQASDGAFYGTTYSGGTGSCKTPYYNGCGTIFNLSVGLGPFVKTLPSAAKVGSEVKILGSSLTGASAVTFNGISAKFTVQSASLIVTHVPKGATTGYVTVITSSGALSSNVAFNVIP